MNGFIGRPRKPKQRDREGDGGNLAHEDSCFRHVCPIGLPYPPLIIALLYDVRERSDGDAACNPEEAEADLERVEPMPLGPKDECESSVQEEADTVEIAIVPV